MEPGGQWNPMNKSKLYTTQRTQAASASGPSKSDNTSAWKPEPCGLTREDLRRIVIEMVG
jgi:hypothetical protein